MFRVVVPLLTLVAFSGCAASRCKTANVACEDCLPPPIAGRYWYERRIDNLVTKCTAQKCAGRDLKQFKKECGPVSQDYRAGYTQAYIDLAFGRPPCVPAVPPPKYWHAWYRSCAGREGVDQWYAGYRSGLDNGMNGGVSRFNRIVGNPEPCCVTAAYINPYNAAPLPQMVRPAGGQTITQKSGNDSAAPNTTAHAEQIREALFPADQGVPAQATSYPSGPNGYR